MSQTCVDTNGLRSQVQSPRVHQRKVAERVDPVAGAFDIDSHTRHLTGTLMRPPVQLPRQNTIQSPSKIVLPSRFVLRPFENETTRDSRAVSSLSNAPIF
jgi:hypothetical protein